MFYILEKELKKKKMTREELSKKLNLSISTVSTKLNGGTQFTIEECKNIKAILDYTGSLDELFKVDS